MTHKSPQHLWTRRKFLDVGSRTAAAMSVAPSILTLSESEKYGFRSLAGFEHQSVGEVIHNPDRIREMAERAITTAMAAGATYADVRLTRNVSHGYDSTGRITDSEHLAIGVRVLANGAWGFASSPYWSLEEPVQLARSAVEQAQFNSRVSRRDIDMGSYPQIKGAWSTPHRIDPFSVTVEEKRDFLFSLRNLVPRHKRNRTYNSGMKWMVFDRSERAVATSNGSYVTQTLFETEAAFNIIMQNTEDKFKNEIYAKGLQRTGAGWELIVDADIRGQIPGLLDQLEVWNSVPSRPLDVGRYDVVVEAPFMLHFIDATLATATQIDRALGHEANARGTSYLGPDPAEFLGSSFSNPVLSIKGDRSMPGGLATVRWDDEGVEPEPFDIIANGVLVDYQTNREHANSLSDWYRQHQKPVRSHGCACASSAIDLPLQFAPNLTMMPGTDRIGLDDLIAQVPKGLALYTTAQAYCHTDFQSRSGVTEKCRFREIKDGKLGDFITGAGVLFDSRELWKSLQAIGGEGSEVVGGFSERKGQPEHSASHSVSAVPALFKNLTVVNPRRRI